MNEMKNEYVPLDVYELTMTDLKIGNPGEADTCPIAFMLNTASQKHNEKGYEQIIVTESDIEFLHEYMDFSKSISWTLAALIQAIDVPNTPIYRRDIQTGEEVHIFGGDKGLHPPYRIEEYENWFNLHLDEYPRAHFDSFYRGHTTDENKSVIKVKFHVSQHTEEDLIGVNKC